MTEVKVYRAAVKTYYRAAIYNTTAAKAFITADKLQITAAKQYRQAAKTKAKELLLPTRGFAIVGLEVIAISSSNSTQLQFGLDE